MEAFDYLKCAPIESLIELQVLKRVVVWSLQPTQWVFMPVLFGTCHHISQGGAAPEGRPAAFMPAPRHTHHISGEQSFTPTSAGFGNRVLVGDPLHNSARNGSTIDRFCETAVIDRLLLPFSPRSSMSHGWHMIRHCNEFFARSTFTDGQRPF